MVHKTTATVVSLCEKAKGNPAALGGMDDKPSESLWVRIRELTTVVNVVVGVSNRSAQEEVDEASRQLEEASYSQDLVIMGNMNHPDVFWKGRRAQAVQEISGVH